MMNINQILEDRKEIELNSSEQSCECEWKFIVRDVQKRENRKEFSDEHEVKLSLSHCLKCNGYNTTCKGYISYKDA